MRPLRRIAKLSVLKLLAALSVIFTATGVLQAGTETLSLDVRPGPDGIEVAALLTDAQGRAVPDAEILFRRRTTFGWLEVARLTTGANGSARIVLPVMAGPRVQVMAVATVGERTVSKTAQVGTGSVSPLQIRPGEAELGAFSPQPGFISPYPPGRLLLALTPILVGIWVTYAVVVYQLYGIIRNC